MINWEYYSMNEYLAFFSSNFSMANKTIKLMKHYLNIYPVSIYFLTSKEYFFFNVVFVNYLVIFDDGNYNIIRQNKVVVTFNIQYIP